jgi:hypothetical protein
MLRVSRSTIREPYLPDDINAKQVIDPEDRSHQSVGVPQDFTRGVFVESIIVNQFTSHCEEILFRL